MFEWIGVGFMLAIGWCLAPFVVGLCLYLIALPFVILEKLLK